MARTKVVNSVLDGMVNVSPSVQRVRLSVRTVAAMGNATRYRAGLGPFGREPMTVEATPEQLEALRADPMLTIVEHDME
jgi:hypothetical protein